MKSRQTQPSILMAVSGLLLWALLFFLIFQKIDWSIITYGIQSFSLVIVGGVISVSGFSYSIKFLNYAMATHYRLRTATKFSQPKHQREIDHIISLIFLYNMSPHIIRLVIPLLLNQLYKSNVSSSVYLSTSDIHTYEKEIELIRSIFNDFIVSRPDANIIIKTVPQQDGMWKKLGAIVPNFRYIREELFSICKGLYGNRFNEEEARSINGPEQMKTFLKKNNSRILFYYVDGDTVLPSTEEVNFFQKVANVLFDSSNNCIAVTTDNFAICPPNVRGNKSLDAVLDYIYTIYTTDIRYLSRVVNLTSTSEVTTVTGRSAVTNAMILFDPEFTKVIENSSNYEFGKKVYYVTGDDKDTRDYYHQIGMKALFLSHLYVYSIEEEPLSNKENWKNYTLPGIWKIDQRTQKNGMRFARKMVKSKDKIPFILRFRYFMQAYVYYSPVLGPLIAYFTTVIIVGDYSILNTGVCFWLFLSTVIKIFEISYTKILRWKFHSINKKDIFLFFLLLPQIATLTRLHHLFVGFQKIFTSNTTDINGYNRVKNKAATLNRKELVKRRLLSITQLLIIISSTYIISHLGVLGVI
ncbi:MAG: hypothetical protein GY828_04645 [Candidatus Gracilibacteria bacterium]|nr:hypothetical protein [Candidatus Gracilibacteria bacterium]